MDRKILIIEDDKFLRELCEKKLKQEGFEVVVAIDGKEGLEKIKTEKPDLVLLDIILPGISGFDILETIQLDAEINNIPVILLTNLGQEEDIKRAKDLGAKGYLIKANVFPSEIVKKIIEVLNNN